MAINSNGSTNISFQKINSGIIFLIIATVYIVCNLIWWQINTPVIPDSISAEHFIHVFRGEGLSLCYVAPLIIWIMRGMFFVFGRENFDLQIIIINYIFFLISLCFVYKIGKKIDSKETGKTAMILFALTPSIYGMTRQFGHHDFHLIAGITFNIYCLIKTNRFTDRKWSIIYGISTGVALLIKDSFGAYFLPPWLYVTIQGVKEKKCNITVNALLPMAIAFFIAGIHYFRQDIIIKILSDTISNSMPVFLFESMRVMTIGLSEELLSPPFFILFLFGFIWFIREYKNKLNKMIVLLWFLIPWAIIMFMPHNKVSEYGAGFIPAMILIISVYLVNIKRRVVKFTILSVIIPIGILQMLIFSYMPKKSFLDIGFKFKEHYISYYNNKFNLYSPYSKQIVNIISYIKSRYPKEIVYIETIDYSNNNTLRMLALKEKLNVFTLDDWTWNSSYFEGHKNEIGVIVYVGEKAIIENMIEFFMDKYDKHPGQLQKIPRQEYFNLISKKVEEFEQGVRHDFKVVEIWDSENNKENLKVEFLERINNNK